MSDAAITMGDEGAIPRLDEELPQPTAETKGKTNVGKIKILGIAIAGLLLIIIGLMLWSKSRASTADSASLPNTKLQTPSFMVRNSAIDNASVGNLKAQIKEREAKEAEARRLEEEEAARRKAELERMMAEMNPQAAPTGIADQNSGQIVAYADDPFARKLRSHVLIPTTGYSPQTSNVDGKGGSTAAASTPSPADEEYKRAEYERRMRTAGLDPDTATSAGASLGGGNERPSVGEHLRNVSVISSVSASRLPNLDYLLKKGTTIPCALKTGINTQLPGFVLCVSIADTYSANGKTLLIERGSTFFGEQQSALQRGQNRTFVVWDRGDTPKGISFNIGSPGTDMLGYSGVPGIVNRHLLERFGGAILISIIDDFANAFADKMAERQNITIGESSAEASQSIAEKTLDESINIPSNLVVKPGTVINILASRDVSFENAYQLIR